MAAGEGGAAGTVMPEAPRSRSTPSTAGRCPETQRGRSPWSLAEPLEGQEAARRRPDWELEIESLGRRETELHRSQLRLVREQTTTFMRDLKVLQHEGLAAAWDSDTPASLRPFATEVHNYLQKWLSTAEVALPAQASRPVPVAPLAVEPAQLHNLAGHFAEAGWVQVQGLGVSGAVLKEVHGDVARLLPEMDRGLTGGSVSPYRNDKIVWLEQGADKELTRHDVPGLMKLHSMLQGFVQEFVQELEGGPAQLALHGQVSPMLARYDSGGYYLPHIDNANSDGRVLTVIYYLNPEWQESHGGELYLYPGATEEGGPESASDIVQIRPEQDTIVLFRADKVLHEVRPNSAKRLALTQWHFGK